MRMRVFDFHSLPSLVLIQPVLCVLVLATPCSRFVTAFGIAHSNARRSLSSSQPSKKFVSMYAVQDFQWRNLSLHKSIYVAYKHTLTTHPDARSHSAHRTTRPDSQFSLSWTFSLISRCMRLRANAVSVTQCWSPNPIMWWSVFLCVCPQAHTLIQKFSRAHVQLLPSPLPLSQRGCYCLPPPPLPPHRMNLCISLFHM